MTIKDIAKAAGVSISTVSKVLNHKDENITEETRQKVLAIVAENHFVPYAKLRNKLSAPSDKIGLLLPHLDTPFYQIFLHQLSALLQKQGYAPMIWLTDYERSREMEGLRYFNEQKLPLILALPSAREIWDDFQQLPESVSELLLLDCAIPGSNCGQYCCDYESAAGAAVEHLFQKGCERIALVTEKGNAFAVSAITKGYRFALTQLLREYDHSLTLDICTQPERIQTLMEAGTDAFLCQNIKSAELVYQAARNHYLSIPQNISVICLEDPGENSLFDPPLTVCSFSPKDLSESIFKYIAAKLNPKETDLPPQLLHLPPTLAERGSVKIQAPQTDGILVIGYMNMDILMRIPHSPKVGKPLSTSRVNYLPGGKAANQAAAAAKIGGNAKIIGILGNDLYGRQVYESLMRSGVDTQGVTFSDELPTGTAYISLLPDGNSLVIGNEGANENLNHRYIEHHLPLFDDNKICLMQMEHPVDTAAVILNNCRERGITTIVKPNPHNPLPQDLYSAINILVPNRFDLEAIIAGEESPEVRAGQLVRQGISHVIVTLGDQGCLWVTSGCTRHFPAQEQLCADATGASDIFIAYLAVLLSEEIEMEAAIFCANYAAGLSVTWEGVQNAVPQRHIVERYAEQYFR